MEAPPAANAFTVRVGRAIRDEWACGATSGGEPGGGVWTAAVYNRNAFLAAPRVQGERFHYFDSGIKRLIIELELDDVCVFLVHLSLKYRHRQYQLRYLHDLIDQVKKPVIVAGDFNERDGRAIDLLRERGFRSALPEFHGSARTWRWRT